MSSFVDKCKELLNEVTDEIKGDDHYYTLKKICLAEYTSDKEKLVLPIGRQENGEYIYMNFEEVSSLFVTGATGTGKSVFLDSLIVSLMLKNSPDEIKLFFFDSKKVELGEYNGINYLYHKKAFSSLKESENALVDILKIMEDRTSILLQKHHKNIVTFNRYNKEKWPHIFIFIDESCDFFKGTEIKKILVQIMDYGKPLGIHLILATSSYLKELSEDGFIDHFKYKMSFDLSSEEQAKYLNIHGSNYLNVGESLIKGTNNQVYQFYTPFVSTEEITRVVLEIGRKR